MRTAFSVLARRATHSVASKRAPPAPCVTFVKNLSGPGAVDAPDGTSDATRVEDKKQVDQIIDYAAEHEDKDKIEFEHKQQMRGVDSPDGTSEAMNEEDMKQVDEIIDYASKHEDKDKIEYEHKMDKAVRDEHARDPEKDW